MKEVLGFYGEEVGNVTFKCNLVEGHTKELVHNVTIRRADWNISSDLGTKNLILGAIEGFYSQFFCENCSAQSQKDLLK